MELFKEKEEQEIIKKDFDPEQGIEIKVEYVELDDITKGKFGKSSKSKAFKTKETLESEFIKLDHNMYEDDSDIKLNFDGILEENLNEAHEISMGFQEELEELIEENN